MKRYFTVDTLGASLQRKSDGKLILNISSDYSGENHKSKLYVNEKLLVERVNIFWKAIKTKKMLGLHVGFGEIDWYTDMVDVYQTPSVFIKRGLKKAMVEAHAHGSIPKDWSFEVSILFADTLTSAPIMEVLTYVLDYHLSSEMQKKFLNGIKPVLQKKEKYVTISLAPDND
jgi:hypothetical protein